MQADLKFVMSCDIDERVYWPEEEDNFSFTIDATIGSRDENAGDILHFYVCTPKWIFANMINKGFDDYGVFGRHMIIVEEYDFDKIKLMLAKLCRDTSGSDWSQIACKLSKHGAWEYTDQT